ncbi:MAG: serine/threonine protein kinase [Acetatifactor sp.]
MKHSIVKRKKLGEGAFSAVYLVEDEHGREYACKESRELKLLRREAEWLERLNIPLFPKYEDFWILEETGYLLMEYLEGETLEHCLQRTGSISLPEVFFICRQLAEGLMLLHEREVPLLYLDLKPENIICCGQGNVRLVDLGLLTEAGVNRARAGSPGYAAPEQFCIGSLLTTGADIYGFGKTLKRLLCKVQSGSGRKRSEDKTAKTALRELADLCTEEEVSKRIPSMRLVRDILLQLTCAGATLPKDALAQALLSGSVQVEVSVFLS